MTDRTAGNAKNPDGKIRTGVTAVDSSFTIYLTRADFNIPRIRTLMEQGLIEKTAAKARVKNPWIRDQDYTAYSVVGDDIYFVGTGDPQKLIRMMDASDLSDSLNRDPPRFMFEASVVIRTLDTL
jgi:hypothetical protein